MITLAEVVVIRSFRAHLSDCEGVSAFRTLADDTVPLAHCRPSDCNGAHSIDAVLVWAVWAALLRGRMQTLVQDALAAPGRPGQGPAGHHGLAHRYHGPTQRGRAACDARQSAKSSKFSRQNAGLRLAQGLAVWRRAQSDSLALGLTAV